MLLLRIVNWIKSVRILNDVERVCITFNADFNIYCELLNLIIKQIRLNSVSA